MSTYLFHVWTISSNLNQLNFHPKSCEAPPPPLKKQMEPKSSSSTAEILFSLKAPAPALKTNWSYPSFALINLYFKQFQVF